MTRAAITAALRRFCRTSVPSHSMYGFFKIRFLRRIARALVVWAMMPLVVLNGRTVVGCGCSGHFEDICRCGTASGNCCKPGGSCCSPGNSKGCSCCNHKKSASSSDLKRDQTANALCHIGSKHCVRIALHDVIPATEVQSDLSDAGLMACLDFGTSADSYVPAVLPSPPLVLPDLKCPPNDLTVSLHRFII